MKHKGKIEHLTPEIMEAYLNGSLDDASMHQVEKLLLDQPFEDEAMEGLSMLSESERTADLAALQKSLSARSESSSFRWYYAAAAIVLIAAVSLLLFLPKFMPSGDSTMIAQQESSSEEAAEPESSEEADPAADTSDLIALNNAPPEASKKPERSADTGVAKKQDEITVNKTLPSAAEAKSSDNDVLEKVEALDVAPEVAAIQEEETRVPLKMPSNERSKVGRVAGEPIPLEDQAGRTIRGRIIMQDGTPLPGVNVAIRGTEQGTNSDIEGYYEIEVPEDATLVFSLLGLEDQAISQPSDPELNVTMKQGDAVLSELLITELNQSDSAQITGATPISGKQAYDRYLRENLRYPPSDLEGTVVIRVEIGTDGSITETAVTRSLDPLFDEEAIRLILEGPIWLPAIKDGTPVTDHVLVEVEFSKD